MPILVCICAGAKKLALQEAPSVASLSAHFSAVKAEKRPTVSLKVDVLSRRGPWLTRDQEAELGGGGVGEGSLTSLGDHPDTVSVLLFYTFSLASHAPCFGFLSINNSR